MKRVGKILWVMLLAVALFAMTPACEGKAKDLLPKLIMGDATNPISEVATAEPTSSEAKDVVIGTPSPEMPVETSPVVEPEPASEPSEVVSEPEPELELEEVTPELVESTPEPSEVVSEEVTESVEPEPEEVIAEPTPAPEEIVPEPEPEITPELEPEITPELEPEPEDATEEIWVLVDISEQRLWCYQGDEILVECDVVTGLANGKRDTPIGEYAIYAKTAGRYLKGTGYKVWVDYWMPFSGGYGLHDALWRDSFGGTIYQKNGSHGCVNMPHEAAAQLYGLVEIGTPVVVRE